MAAHFVAERFWPGATEEAARDAMDRLRSSCDRLAATGASISILSATFVAEDEALSCRLEGTAQAVHALYELTGITFDRLLVAVDLTADGS